LAHETALRRTRTRYRRRTRGFRRDR
jgi:hypothetical protein